MNLAIPLSLALVAVLSMAEAEHSGRHKRAWIIDSFSIVEEHPGPFPYILGQIKVERSSGIQMKLFGQGVEEEPKGLLELEPETGIVRVLKKVDHEVYSLLKLVFEVRDKKNQTLDTRLGVEIRILDINDNAPIFQRDVYEANVSEAEEQGSFILGVYAFDPDEHESPNSTFDYRIISATPSTPNAEFYIQENGAISYKGCLDYETADAYTIVIEAKDHGVGGSLSSSTTVVISVLDGNNQLPVITGHTGTGRVWEGEVGVSPLRIQVSDADSPHSEGWNAKYTLAGDEGEHFHIETDPETNDGILTVVKPLDFEEGVERKLYVSVENIAPYFSCEVREKTTEGLWTVIHHREADGRVRSEYTITLEDVNDVPIFSDPITQVYVEENVEIGFFLTRVTATDQDFGLNGEFVYRLVEDPGDWVSLDPQNGDMYTTKILDRESEHVINNTYQVILHAIDKGVPPLTGTSTILLHLVDQNDNTPELLQKAVYICEMEDVSSSVTISASDPDGEPYGGPFHFEVLGKGEEEWLFDPNYGNPVQLVKGDAVYAGIYTLVLRVSDRQGHFALQNLSVTACDCSITPQCLQRATTVNIGASGILITLLCLLLLLGCLLLSLSLACGQNKPSLQVEHMSGDSLLAHNTETPGMDCKVPDIRPIHNSNMDLDNNHSFNGGGSQQTHMNQLIINQTIFVDEHCDHMDTYWHDGRYDSVNQGFMVRGNHSVVRENYSHVISRLLNQRLQEIQAPMAELHDYSPHPYAYEGELVSLPDLDPILIPDDHLSFDELDDLCPIFNQLAAICTSDGHKP